MSSSMELSVSPHTVAQVCLRALLDIDGLLDVGFDTNIRDCEMESVAATIAELRDLIADCGYEEWLHERPFVELSRAREEG